MKLPISLNTESEVVGAFTALLKFHQTETVPAVRKALLATAGRIARESGDPQMILTVEMVEAADDFAAATANLDAAIKNVDAYNQPTAPEYEVLVVGFDANGGY